MCYIRIYISRILKIYSQDNLKNTRNAKISYIQKILNLKYDLQQILTVP